MLFLILGLNVTNISFRVLQNKLLNPFDLNNCTLL